MTPGFAETGIAASVKTMIMQSNFFMVKNPFCSEKMKSGLKNQAERQIGNASPLSKFERWRVNRVNGSKCYIFVRNK
jgi:hypothetical protein